MGQTNWSYGHDIKHIHNLERNRVHTCTADEIKQNLKIVNKTEKRILRTSHKSKVQSRRNKTGNFRS